MAALEWLNPKREFEKNDRKSFEFYQDEPCAVKIIKLWEEHEGSVKSDTQDFNSVQDYKSWTENCRPSPTGNHVPHIFLIMHQRLEGDFMKSSSLPFRKKTFHHVCKQLFQHCSVASPVSRTSTAVFTSRSVDWENESPWGRSIVYNCKSDTESPTKDDDIVLSTTSFLDTPVTYGVMYGCTTDTMKRTANYLEELKGTAFHPLILPMIYAELERTRLLNALDHKGTELGQRILNMENMENKETKENKEKIKGKDTPKKEKEKGNQMTKRDCESTKLWLSISKLKNGLQSFRTALVFMMEHSRTLSETEFNPLPGLRSKYYREREAGDRIQSRLQEMITELESKVRFCDGLLGGMGLATQIEWNFHTRREAETNIYIAYAAKRDSSQMRYISFLGMIFLPGTFLATLFSMSFFNWSPSESNQTISPWIGLYCALTVVLTGGTVLAWDRRTKSDDKSAEVEMKEKWELDPEKFAM